MAVASWRFAVLIGLASFLRSAGFQLGNILGVTTATDTVTDNRASSRRSAPLGRPVVEEPIRPLVSPTRRS